MWKTLQQQSLTYWQEASPAQRVLFMSGSLLFVWMVLHIGLLLVTDSPLHGPVSYRKAATFAETGWLMCWSIGYVLPYLRLNNWQKRGIVGGTLLFALGETFLMSVQVWRGEPSHYNFSTIPNSILFGTTGLIAFLWFLAMLLLLWRILRPNRLSASFRLAYTVGTLLMILGGLTGFAMMFNLSGVYQADFIQNVQTLVSGDMIGTFTGQPADSGGNIVILHALGVHGLEVIPLAAWLLSYTSLADSRRLQITAGVAGLYLVLIAAFTLPMLQTQPLSQLSLPFLSLLAVLIAALIGLYLWISQRTLPHLLQTDRQ